MSEEERASRSGIDPSADWRAASVRGDFDVAARLADVAALGTVDPPTDLERETIDGLAAMRRDLRAKRWGDVKAWLDGSPSGVDALVPGGSWSSAVSEARSLSESGASIDVRSIDDAVAILDGLSEDQAVFPAEWLAQRGTTLVLLGASSEAEGRLGRAVEIDPLHVRARVNLGNVLLERGDLDGAVTCYRRALDVDGEDPHALHNLGVALRKQGKIGESVAALRKAHKADQKRAARPVRRRAGRGGGDASGAEPARPTILGIPRSWLVALAIGGAAWWAFVR